MLKLVSRPPRAPLREPHKRGNTREGVRALYQQIEEDRAVGQSTQRAVARGRRTIVEVQCGLQRAASLSAPRQTSAAPVIEPARVLAEVTGRLENIHQRLLSLSTSVELEMDRLDMVRTEIEQITGGGRPGASTR